MSASEIRKRRIEGMEFSQWLWHLEEVFVKINGQRHCLWRAVGNEGGLLDRFVSERRDKKAVLKLLKQGLRKHDQPDVIVNDRLRSNGAASNEIGSGARRVDWSLDQQPR